MIAIDPGPVESAWVLFEHGAVLSSGIEQNETVRQRLRLDLNPVMGQLAIEMVQSFGMPVGREVFETVFWTGRFVEAWNGPFTLVYRQQIKLHLCNSVKAKDANIRQALIDRIGAPGTKKNPGPTYGVK